VPSLDEIAARDFRARMFRLLALILFGLAALTLLVALLGWLRRSRKAELATARHFLPARKVLATVRGELAEIQRQTRGAGWSADPVARALAAARIVGSYFSGQAVAQHEADQSTGGELAVAGGVFGRRHVAVSAATTGLALAGAPAGDLDAALNTLTAARYGRSDTYDNSELDDALGSVMRAADRAASRHSWLAESTRSIGRTVRGWAPQAWAR
jgi:hypothetical protein